MNYDFGTRFDSIQNNRKFPIGGDGTALKSCWGLTSPKVNRSRQAGLSTEPTDGRLRENVDNR
jgi:hypothetical protein